MSKSKLTDAQKDMIVLNFQHKRMTISKMSDILEVSERTIGRVLKERGLSGPITQQRDQAMRAFTLIKAAGIDSETKLIRILDAHKNGPDRSDVLNFMANMEEHSYYMLLSEIVHLREAKKHNISVNSAMLKLERKAEDNANDTKAG